MRTYVRRKVFYKTSVISVIRHHKKRPADVKYRLQMIQMKTENTLLRTCAYTVRRKDFKTRVFICICIETGAPIWENRCTHLTKQVHLFGLTGAPVLDIGRLLV